MTEDPGSGQSPRRTGRPVDAEDPTSGLGSPSEPNATSSLREIDAAITSLRAGEGDMAAPNPWLDRLELRSQNPLICPFLRAVEDDDRLLVPIEAPDALNRCAALHDAIPQSLRQQELVCLTSGHVNCPRYLRGALVAGETPATADRCSPGAPPVLGPAPAGHQGDPRRAARPGCLVLGVDLRSSWPGAGSGSRWPRSIARARASRDDRGGPAARSQSDAEP